MPICPIILAFESLTGGVIWFGEAPLVLKIALTILLAVNFVTFANFACGGSSTFSRIMYRIACYGSFITVIAGCWLSEAWAGIFSYGLPLVLVLIFDINRNLRTQQKPSV